jgi:hypothetical protein
LQDYKLEIEPYRSGPDSIHYRQQPWRDCPGCRRWPFARGVRVVQLALGLIEQPFSGPNSHTEADFECRCVHAGHRTRGIQCHRDDGQQPRRCERTSVVVYAQAYPDATTADAISPQQIAAAINSGSGVTNAKSVSGIGDKAVEYSITTGGGNGIVIFVFKSNVVVMVAVTPATSSTAIEQLAKTAVGRL